MQKESEVGKCNRGGENNDDSKKGKEEKRVSTCTTHVVPCPTIQPWLDL